MTKTEITKLTYAVIGCAIEVHKQLRPGLLESVYEFCLIDELRSKQIQVSNQVCLPIVYKEKKLEQTFRVDLLVENILLIELKAVETMHPLFEAQLLTYMKLADIPKGILINFNTTNISKDLKQFVNEKYRQLPE